MCASCSEQEQVALAQQQMFTEHLLQARPSLGCREYRDTVLGLTGTLLVGGAEVEPDGVRQTQGLPPALPQTGCRTPHLASPISGSGYEGRYEDVTTVPWCGQSLAPRGHHRHPVPTHTPPLLHLVGFFFCLLFFIFS